MGLYAQRANSTGPKLPYTYKVTELSEDLNYGMDWVFRYYGISLKQSKDTLTPRESMV